jgi:hypothetical protein
VTRRLADCWLDRPKLDYLLVILVAAAIGVLNPGSLLPDASRATFYETLAGVSGILLSVGTITITVFFAVAPTERLDRVLDAVGQRLRRLVISSLSGLVLTTGGFLGLFLIDRQTDRLQLVVVFALVTFMALRFTRLWWLLNAMLAVLSTRPTEVMPMSWERPKLKRTDYRLGRRRARRTMTDD